MGSNQPHTELDKILDSFFTVGTERKISELKQEVLDWHNKQMSELLDRLESKAFYDPSGTSPLINPREIQA